LREILKHGEVALGVTVSIGHPYITDVLGGVGYDFINFDAQHTPMSMETIQTMLQAMSYSQTTPIIRVQWNDFGIINRALDIGAQGIVIPFVNTKEDVLKAIENARYAPIGMRSYGPVRAALRDPEYVHTSDEEVLILPQIETKESLDNIEEILSVDGVEAFFVGPYDLSRSLGVFTQWHHPTFDKAIEKVLETAENTGTVPGMLALTEEAQKTIERGFRLVNLGRDTSMLAQIARSDLQKAKGATVRK